MGQVKSICDIFDVWPKLSFTQWDRQSQTSLAISSLEKIPVFKTVLNFNSYSYPENKITILIFHYSHHSLYISLPFIQFSISVLLCKPITDHLLQSLYKTVPVLQVDNAVNCTEGTVQTVCIN